MRCIKINTNAIQKDTDRAYLIKLPREKRYFWYPKSLTRKNRELTLLIPEDFIFETFRNGKFRKTGIVNSKPSTICNKFGYEFDELQEDYLIEDLLEDDEW